MGPGPSAVHRRVYEALSKRLVGHLDPEFIRIMNETQAMLRHVFRTENRLGGGLGPLAGKVWRIGLMGESSQRENVVLFLAALESILFAQGVTREIGPGLEAAARVYAGPATS